jgi:hypothetical protein
MKTDSNSVKPTQTLTQQDRARSCQRHIGDHKKTPTVQKKLPAPPNWPKSHHSIEEKEDVPAMGGVDRDAPTKTKNTASTRTSIRSENQ